MDYELFYREERQGKYKGCKFPNLVETQKQGCLYVGYFANVTDELLLAVYRGEEELTAEEMRRVAYYNGIPLSVLTCPKIIMLDMRRARHRKMVTEVDNIYITLKHMAEEGNREAEKYLEWADREQQRFMRAAHYNRLSYIHYLGAREQLRQYISFSMPKAEKRGIKRGIASRKGGAM